MKLKQPIQGVQPYRVSPKEVGRMKDGDEVITVCHSADFMPKLGSPKHVGFCHLGKVYWPGNPTYTTSDCDAGGFCSGGSMLSGNEDDPALLAITQGVNETPEEEDESIRHNRVNKKPYDEANWSSGFVTVKGDFLEAIKSACSQNPIREREAVAPPSAPPPVRNSPSIRERPSQDGVDI
jgi:hypothetical protein